MHIVIHVYYSQVDLTGRLTKHLSQFAVQVTHLFLLARRLNNLDWSNKKSCGIKHETIQTIGNHCHQHPLHHHHHHHHQSSSSSINSATSSKGLFSTSHVLNPPNLQPRNLGETNHRSPTTDKSSNYQQIHHTMFEQLQKETPMRQCPIKPIYIYSKYMVVQS